MHSLKSLIGTNQSRPPLEFIRVQLSMAEADLNGLLQRIAAGHADIAPAGIDPIKYAREISSRVFAYRHALDEARIELMPFETINGSHPCPNNADDMGDVVHHALERLITGVDDTAHYRLPAHAADIRRGNVK